jgi:hypothetical protein
MNKMRARAFKRYSTPRITGGTLKKDWGPDESAAGRDMFIEIAPKLHQAGEQLTPSGTRCADDVWKIKDGFPRPSLLLKYHLAVALGDHHLVPGLEFTGE